MTTYVLSGGTIFDGTGGPSYIGDALVDDGVIVDISRHRITHAGAEVIDAADKWVMPGFVDNHTHYVLDAADKTMIGKSFTEIANERGQHPVDTFLDLVVEQNKGISWETTIGNEDPTRYKALYNDPNGIFGFADSGAHINNMAFYNLPLRVLRYVQASHQAGAPLMSYEKTVWRLTKENADFFNLDAGHLAVGKRADITMIDPAKLTDDVHQVCSAEFLQGLERLVNRGGDAVEVVMINGKLAWRGDGFTPAFGHQRFGQFLRGKHAYA